MLCVKESGNVTVTSVHSGFVLNYGQHNMVAPDGGVP